MSSLRPRVLVVTLALLAGLGMARRVTGAGAAPPPCAAPALVGDGRLVCDGAGAPPGAAAWLVGGRLDVNQATRADLLALPRVGPSLADAILAHRVTHGPFTSVRALDDVPGIGPKTLARLAPLLDVGAAMPTGARDDGG